MKSKAAFIVGAGLGYVLGTRAGRQQFDKLKGWSQGAWDDPRVQSQVSDVQSQVSDLGARAAEYAKTEGSTIKDKVTESVLSVVDTVKGAAGGTGWVAADWPEPGADDEDGALATPPGTAAGA